MKIQIKEALCIKNSVIIDVRSQKEYLESHITTAINIPILSNSTREEVGIIYKKFGREQAIKKGLDLTSPKLSKIIEQFMKIDNDKNIILYCARGGLRSLSIYNILSTFREKVYIIDGGYKAYRNYIIDTLDNVIKNIKFYVLQGHTGVGKTIILREFEKNGGNVLNLEEIAKNAGSVFGNIPFDKEQPSQKQFENNLFYHLTKDDKIKLLFTEAENRRIGKVLLPECFYIKLINSERILISTNIKNRIYNIKQDYFKFLNFDDKSFENAIKKLKKILGNKKVEELTHELKNKNIDYVIEELMINYYDKLYDKYIDDKFKYLCEINYNNIKEVIFKLKEIQEYEFSK